MGNAQRLLETARALQQCFLDDLEQLVAIDSGSHDAPGVNKIADLLVERLETLGCTVQRIPAPADEAGDVVVATLGGPGVSRVLLLAHLDTVFEAGTAGRRPFRVEPGGRAYGPGVTDDKAGALAAVYALRTLVEAGADVPAEVVVCLSPDEEIGSPTARPHIERLAADADVVLSLECAREDGALVAARKGVADVDVRLTGRASHAGIEPERGSDAALAAARLALELSGVAGLVPGVTVNVGILRAGTRVNIVCDDATLGLEVRARSDRDLDTALREVERRVAAASGPGITAAMVVSARCPAWSRDASSDVLVELAGRVGAELGVPVRAVATGGAADANYAAAVGTPTLDGLGPVGGGDHSDAEWLDTTSILSRVALLAGILERLAEGGGAA